MCLIANVCSRKIAEEDIHVYKVIRKRKFFPNRWFGPYTTNLFGFKYDTVLTEKMKPEDRMVLPTFSHLIEIGPGFFHSDGNLHWATHRAWHLHDNAKLKNVTIVKATIPKGSCYYYGCGEYASEKLIVHKPITEPCV